MFEIRRKHAMHAGRTKSYQVWVIGKKDGRWVTINQWGKSDVVRAGHGKGGQVSAESFVSENVAVMTAETKLSDKEKRGYEFEGWRVETCSDTTLMTRLEEVFGRREDGADCVQLYAWLTDNGKMVELTEPPGKSPKGKKRKEPELEEQRPPEWGSW